MDIRRFGRLLGRVLLTLALLLAALFLFGPREPAELAPRFDAAALPADLDAWLAEREARFPDIRPGAEKRIVWAGEAGARTGYAVIYLHGFSASAAELSPVPERVAEALGANLFFTRLAGHGRTGAAMAEPRVQDWMDDVAEALAIGERIGERVFVIATSTGGTLAAAAANDPDLAPKMAGIVFVSPNFGLNHWAAPVATWPLARYWVPWLLGAETGFDPGDNALMAANWTTRYPTVALVPLGALVRAVRAMDYTGTPVPALFLYSEADRVVDPAATADIAGQWGGPVVVEIQDLGPEDDAWAHLIAGDTLSPGRTQPVAAAILAWIRSH